MSTFDLTQMLYDTLAIYIYMWERKNYDIQMKPLIYRKHVFIVKNWKLDHGYELAPIPLILGVFWCFLYQIEEREISNYFQLK